MRVIFQIILWILYIINLNLTWSKMNKFCFLWNENNRNNKKQLHRNQIRSQESRMHIQNLMVMMYYLIILLAVAW